MVKATAEERRKLEKSIRDNWEIECKKQGVDHEDPTVAADNALFNAYVVAFADESKWGPSWFATVAKMSDEERQALADENNS